LVLRSIFSSILHVPTTSYSGHVDKKEEESPLNVKKKKSKPQLNFT